MTSPRNDVATDKWGLSAAEAGMRAARLVERVADGIAILACVFFVAATMWELAGPLPGGHFGASGAEAIEGENFLLWPVFAAVQHYVPALPTPDLYYCHHPYGLGVVSALGTRLFGHHWFTVRVPAIVCSGLSGPLVYAIGRAIWGRVPAAVATVVFVFVPIDLAFSSFASFEVPTIFFGLLFSWGTVRLWQTWRGRWVAVATVGALGACQSDWVGLVLCAVVVTFAFVRAYVVPRRIVGRIDDRAHALWLAYVVAAAVGTFALYLFLFARAGQLTDVLDSYRARTSGSDSDLYEVITQRRAMWLDWMLTRGGIQLLLVGLPLAAVRLVRRPSEVIPIAWALAATFQYFLFKEGADVHIFWPHYYGPAIALSAGVIAATLLSGRRRLLRAVSVSARALVARPTAHALVVLAVLPVAYLVRVALPELAQSRMTGGRFDDGGRWIATDADVAQFARWAVHDMPEAAPLAYAPSLTVGFNVEYGAHREVREYSRAITATGPDDPERIVLLDARATPLGQLRAVARHLSVQIVGPYWRIDRARRGPDIEAMRYDEHQPGPLEWLFISGTDLARSIGPDIDPFATWEWADAFDVDAASPPTVPGSFDELRIAYNVALAHGDEAHAALLRERVLAAVERPVRIDFTNDMHLRDVDVDAGAATVVTLLWETGPKFEPVDSYFDLRCKVTEPPRFYWGMTDYFEKDMAPVPALRPAMYKPGRLYVQRFIALHRLGVETCRGGFTGSAAPRLQSGDLEMAVFTLR